MAMIHTIRDVLLAVVLVFSVIVLGLGAHLTSLTTEFGFYFVFAALGIATSLLTLIAIPVMVFIDRTRTNAFTSKIVVELVVLGVLTVLWLATAADTASFGVFIITCGDDGSCNELRALEAFAFLNWLMLMGWCITLVVLSIMSGSKGRSVWNTSVKDADFFSPAGHSGGQGSFQPQMQSAQYPPSTVPHQGNVHSPPQGSIVV